MAIEASMAHDVWVELIPAETCHTLLGLLVRSPVL